MKTKTTVSIIQATPGWAVALVSDELHEIFSEHPIVAWEIKRTDHGLYPPNSLGPEWEHNIERSVWPLIISRDMNYGMPPFWVIRDPSGRYHHPWEPRVFETADEVIAHFAPRPTRRRSAG